MLCAHTTPVHLQVSRSSRSAERGQRLESVALMLSCRGALLAALVAVAEPHAHPFTSPEDHAPRSAPSLSKAHGRISKARGMDVLMIVVDDLRAQLECSTERGFAKPAMHTPHLCELARKSLMMQRSHVAMATCGPSRASILTSRHPSTTRVWDTYSYWRNVSGNFTTIPQYFKEQGYMTAGMGKIFHGAQFPWTPGQCGKGQGECFSSGAWDGNFSWSQEAMPYFNFDNWSHYGDSVTFKAFDVPEDRRER